MIHSKKKIMGLIVKNSKIERKKLSSNLKLEEYVNIEREEKQNN
jgi:hypothetical protein